MGDVIDVMTRFGLWGIGARLRRARLEKGLSQDQLARAAGLSVEEISSFESGPNRIGADELRLLAAAFDAPVAELVGDADYGEGELATPEEVLTFLTAAIALPAPIRMELQRLAEALARQLVT
jgi:transcriptional regulator with XRE-family HTH domain